MAGGVRIANTENSNKFDYIPFHFDFVLVKNCYNMIEFDTNEVSLINYKNVLNF